MSDIRITPPFLKKTIQNIYGLPFVDGNKVTLLWKGKESFQMIFDAMRKARELICLEFYIFRNDDTGTELAEILKQKASEGVNVYVIYDHFGSFGTPMKFWKDLKRTGVHVRASHPLRWTDPFHYIHRDHKKLIIVDGVKAFTGGLNVANEYRGYHPFKKKKEWRDTGIFLEGPIAKTLLDIFRKSWQIWKGSPIQFHKDVEILENGIPVLPIFADSAKGRRKMRKLLYYSINRSQKSIHLTTAYFAPSRRMLQILADAVARGVCVKLLLPGKSDILPVHYAGRAFFTKLLKSGVAIYIYKGEILHAKTFVFDGLWSIIGSANIDFQSLRRNDEGNVGVIDKTFSETMIEIFHEDLKQSEKITLDIWLRRPFLEKMIEKLFAIFRKRL